MTSGFNIWLQLSKLLNFSPSQFLVIWCRSLTVWVLGGTHAWWLYPVPPGPTNLKSDNTLLETVDNTPNTLWTSLCLEPQVHGPYGKSSTGSIHCSRKWSCLKPVVNNFTSYTQRVPGKPFRLLLNYPFKDAWHLASRKCSFNTCPLDSKANL